MAIILKISTIIFQENQHKPLSANSTLKQLIGKLSTNCLSEFDRFMGLVLKGFIFIITIITLLSIMSTHNNHPYHYHDEHTYYYPITILSKIFPDMYPFCVQLMFI